MRFGNRAKLIVLGFSLFVGACSEKSSNPAPPRLTEPLTLVDRPSTIRLPVGIPLQDISRAINREIPELLLTINEPQQTCIKTKSKLLPDITCRLNGSVRRGHIRLTGSGDTLVLNIPIRTTVSAEHIGKIIKKETATGAIVVKARIKLGLKPNWEPTAHFIADYDWTNRIGIDFLGRRITFASKVDPKLKAILAQLERCLPGELKRLQAKEKVQSIWAKGFTSIRVKSDPLIWARFTPQKIGFSGYRVENGKLVIGFSAMARTQTVFGERLPDPPVTPVPNLIGALPPTGINVHVPVLVRYVVLEEIARKVIAAHPRQTLTVAGGGKVEAIFHDVVIYGVPGDHLAVGLSLSLKTLGGMISTRGTVWFIARPAVDIPNKIVGIRDLRVAGQMESKAFDLLLEVINHSSIRDRLIQTVRYDFSRDYADGLRKADEWLAAQPLEGFVFKGELIGAHILDARIAPDGLLVEADASGTAAMTYDPPRAAKLVAERHARRAARERANALREQQKAPRANRDR